MELPHTIFPKKVPEISFVRRNGSIQNQMFFVVEKGSTDCKQVRKTYSSFVNLWLKVEQVYYGITAKEPKVPREHDVIVK